MGALSRFKTWLSAWPYWPLSSYGQWLDRYANEIFDYTPGLTIGSSYEYDPMGDPGVYYPTQNGEKDGEIYISNDLAPAQMWIWQGGSWSGITGGAGALPNTNHALVWDDLQGPIYQAAGTSALTQEVYRDTEAVTPMMRHDQDDSLTFWMQMPHTWSPDTEVRVHAHVIPLVTPGVDQNVRFGYSYAWGKVFQELPAAIGWTSGTADLSIPASGARTEKHWIVPLFNSTPSGAKESAFLVFNLKRLGTDPADTYTTNRPAGPGITPQANLAIMGVDAHFQKEKVGSLTEIPS
jgi:hypothetical protein